MAVSGLTEGLMWTITDHGGENRVYGLTEDGKRVVGSKFFLLPIFPQVDVILDGVDNDDWEDIAVNIEVAILPDNLTSNVKMRNIYIHSTGGRELHICFRHRRQRP